MPERQWRAAARLKVSVDCAESDWRCGPLQAHVGRIMVVQPDEEAWRSGRGATGARTARAVTIIRSPYKFDNFVSRVSTHRKGLHLVSGPYQVHAHHGSAYLPKQ